MAFAVYCLQSSVICQHLKIEASQMHRYFATVLIPMFVLLLTFTKAMPTKSPSPDGGKSLLVFFFRMKEKRKEKKSSH